LPAVLVLRVGQAPRALRDREAKKANRGPPGHKGKEESPDLLDLTGMLTK
jgi:hypothetical protein